MVAKKINLSKFIFLFLLSLSTLFLSSGIGVASVYAERNTGCSEIVMEVSSGRVLYENHAREKKFMASTTKIVTAITVIEHCNLEEVVTVGKETVGVEGSSIYLEAGEKLTVKELLYGLMLRSGNDAAETLAVHCSGSISDFAELMNATAKLIGANDSHFVNPHGLHDDEHYTTAYDLALISRYAMKNEAFREIVGSKVKSISWTTREYDRKLINKNKMLYEFDGANGIKTGYTKNAGRCLVSSCVRNGMELICVVLNCPPMFERSKELLTNVFNDYSMYKVIESDNILGFIKNFSEEKVCGVHVKKDMCVPLTETEANDLKIVYDYPEYSESLLEKDVEIGFVKIYSQNKLLFSEKIYTI